eukprot:gene341-biopygen134
MFSLRFRAGARSPPPIRQRRLDVCSAGPSDDEEDDDSDDDDSDEDDDDDSDDSDDDGAFSAVAPPTPPTRARRAGSRPNPANYAPILPGLAGFAGLAGAAGGATAGACTPASCQSEDGGDRHGRLDLDVFKKLEAAALNCAAEGGRSPAFPVHSRPASPRSPGSPGSPWRPGSAASFHSVPDLADDSEMNPGLLYTRGSEMIS